MSMLKVDTVVMLSQASSKRGHLEIEQVPLEQAANENSPSDPSSTHHENDDSTL
jgi:hypothetical protein